MARRRKPHDPSAAIRAENARREQDELRKHLDRQDAEYTTDTAGRIISARRSNVFRRLLIAKTITPNQHDAAYTLANEWAAWKGLDGQPERGGGGSGSRELVSDRMISAGKRINAVFEQITDLGSVTLLHALMTATVEEDRPMHWRGLVQRVTGEANEKRQAKHVVDALEALRVVYQEPRARIAA